ncbi:unnamed protein product [Caenorhabditis bovis]|uniref:Derlin n=1 Tax=Caenorhabditis bovis TaxID=2654633 RepID=A0A8S1FAQ8_9PELO|nr:unnamed protein product [Caenorhabditis bovis]
MSDLGDWLRTVPIITRHWFVISVILPLLGRFGFINPAWMFLEWNLVINKFQIWRPITALLFYPLSPQTGFNWLMMVYFLYTYSKSLESDIFSGRPADYLYMLLISWFVCAGMCMAIGVYFLLEPMVMCVLYVWCQMNKDTIVSFWFGMRFKAAYLPWVLCGFNAILRGGGLNELIGIFVGHVYYFLAFQYPGDHNGVRILETPEFMYQLLPNEEGGVHGFGGSEEARRNPPRPRGHVWGQGVRLGQ